MKAAKKKRLEDRGLKVEGNPTSNLQPPTSSSDPFAELTADDRLALEQIAKLWTPRGPNPAIDMLVADPLRLSPPNDEELEYRVGLRHVSAVQKLIRLCSAIEQAPKVQAETDRSCRHVLEHICGARWRCARCWKVGTMKDGMIEWDGTVFGDLIEPRTPSPARSENPLDHRDDNNLNFYGGTS